MWKHADAIIYSPTDLIHYLRSPFASWMYRYELENPGAITRDEETEEEKLFSSAGGEHEAAILANFKISERDVVEISREDVAFAKAKTIAAIQDKVPIIFQAALEDGVFAGFADFLKLDQSGKYQVWDTKLARSPKPYYAIQLCCYSEMLAAVTGQGATDKRVS
jgi:predicted RecB family nuclease